jgi:hypothetical protein
MILPPTLPADISLCPSATSDSLNVLAIGIVYSSTAADADDFGAINDIVLDQNGDVQIVILAVGGFLGIGEKSVAVDYSEFKVAKGADGRERFVLTATKAAFAAAPNFSFGDAQATLPSPGGSVTDHPTDTAQACGGRFGYIQRRASLMIGVAPVFTQGPWATSSCSGFQSRTV